MPSFTDQAVVLKRHNLGEADRILTLLTQYHGRISAVAKGIRKTKSRKGGNLELFNLAEVKVHPGKNLDIVTEANALKTFDLIKKDLQRTGQAYYICELVYWITPENKEIDEVFSLTRKVLDGLNSSTDNGQIEELLKNFEIKLLKESGFWSDKMFRDKKPQTLDEWRRFNRVFIEQIIDRRLNSPRTFADS